MSVAVVLALIAIVLAGIELFRSQGQSLIAWAVVALAAIHLLGLL